MVTETDVREFLNNIPEARIPTVTIAKQIEVANTTVQSEKSASATAEQIEDATMVYAAYLSMIAYAQQLERSVGTVPPAVEKHINFLARLSDAMMQYVKRASQTYQPLVAQPQTLMEQFDQGDLSGDHY